jgi:hypothetical protein
MKEYRFKLLAVLLLGGSLMLGSVAYGMLQVPPAPAPVPWTVDDNENEDVVIDRSAKKTTTDFTITNNGADTSIKVRIKNAQGGLVESKVINAPDSFSGTIPKGGSVTIEDENDSDPDGASGTYTTT